MSKIFEATATVAREVKIAGVTVPGAIILSEGNKASTGLLILEGSAAWYIPTDVTDLKTTIEKVIEIIDDIASALNTIGTSLTSIGAVPAAAWVPPPTIAADVVAINLKITELNATKTALNTLKGELI